MRIPRYSVALFAALTLAGSVGAATQTEQAPDTAPAVSQELLDRLARAELLAGLTEVTGPGLIVTLRTAPHAPKGVDPKDLLVLDQDLNGVLNALRLAGAEALAVSGAGQTVAERILVTSAAKADGEGMLINGARLLPPYRILAVGGSDAMRRELFRPGGVVKKANLDALKMIELENVSRLVIPACQKTAEPRFARAAGQSESPAATPVAPMPAVTSQPQEKPLPSESLLPGTALTTPTGNPSRVVAVLPRVKTPGVREQVKLPAVKPEPQPVKPELVKPEPIKPEPVASKAPDKEPAKPRAIPMIVKAPPVAPSAAPMPAADLGLFGGKGLAKYHAAGCRFGERIEKGERVLFNSADAARQAGRVPCSICLPGAGERSASH